MGETVPGGSFPMQDETFFSVVIPVFNRARLVRRAIDSCLRQRHASFEVVVVDDCSTDGTRESIAAIEDPRLRLVVQPFNQGTSPARNAGMRHARGTWIVFLDSDDELVPDALSTMEAEIGTAGEVDGFRFMCRLDDGSLSPHPPLKRETWGYEEFVKWAGRVSVPRANEETRQESLMCVRRRTFPAVQWATGRGILEGLFNLDFAAKFRTATSPCVVRLYHQDADNQLTAQNAEGLLRISADVAKCAERVLERHGHALASWAPALFNQYMRELATQRFLAGERGAGIKTALRLLREDRASLNAWAVLVLGTIDRRVLAAVKARRGA